MADHLPALTWGDPVDHNNREVRDEPAICPFVVIVDTREQAPFSFQGIRNDSDKKYRPLIVYTERAGLATGDYSIKGFENRIAIERKSLADLFSTFTHERERFIRELERMQSLEFAAVIIEGTEGQIANGPDRVDRTDVHKTTIGKTCLRSIIAWEQRYNVRFHACESRAWAERRTFRMLERFWKDRQPCKAEKLKRHKDATAASATSTAKLEAVSLFDEFD